MTSEYDLRVDEDEQDGALLRISRDATVADVRALWPDKTDDELAEWLTERRAAGTVVTFAVTLDVPTTSIQAWGEEVPVREVTGLIFGPPGSERFLRKPVDRTPPADGLRLMHHSTAVGAAVEVRLADGTVTADIPLSCTFTVLAEGPSVYELTGHVGGNWVHYTLNLDPREPVTLKFGDSPRPERNVDLVVRAEDDAEPDDAEDDQARDAELRIYPDEQAGTFTVADGSGWYPGIYASEEAARFAPRVWRQLDKRTHWNVRGEGADYRPVTLDELRAWAEETKPAGEHVNCKHDPAGQGSMGDARICSPSGGTA